MFTHLDRLLFNMVPLPAKHRGGCLPGSLVAVGSEMPGGPCGAECDSVHHHSPLSLGKEVLDQTESATSIGLLVLVPALVPCFPGPRKRAAAYPAHLHVFFKKPHFLPHLPSPRGTCFPG